MPFVFSPAVLQKLLDKHGVTRREVEQCFENLEGRLLLDTREDHKTDPPTKWFVAPTNANRKLKVAFVQNGADIHIKTAYEANEEERRIYEKFGKK